MNQNDWKPITDVTISLFNLAEERTTLNNGKQVGEDSDVTLQKILMVANKIDANVTAQDITIAHRLPTHNSRSHRPFVAEVQKLIF